ncbi:MAG: Mur ligase family protein [Alphaproteobacteria bacterium]
MVLLTGLLLLVAMGFFSWRRLLVFMQFFQQEEYDSRRYLAWLARQYPSTVTVGYGILDPVLEKISNKAIDKQTTVVLFLLALACFFIPNANIALSLFSLLASLSLILVGVLTDDPRIKAKKKLNLTPRAKRIMTTAIIIATLVFLFLSTLFMGGVLGKFLASVITLQLLCVVLPVANMALAVVEQQIQKKYLDEAREKLSEVSVKIIGITGSYGKTSTKHYLGHILSSVAPTLITAGSINTLMGVCRMIREDLNNDHRFFVVEMGAYAPGSIAKLCDLVNPRFGGITAIGYAHYERFKNLEQVASAKFELARSVLVNSGQMVINADQIDEKFIEKHVSHPNRYTLISQIPHPKLRTWQLSDIKETINGISFTLEDDSGKIALDVPIYGYHQVWNVAEAYALAVQAGVPRDTVVASLRSVKQTPHRLEVKKDANKAWIIDDAYNSNPTGFEAALRTLAILGKNRSGKRILVTPGMVELGELHNEWHYKTGLIAGECADILLLIHADRIPTFVRGFEDGWANCKKKLQDKLTPPTPEESAVEKETPKHRNESEKETKLLLDTFRFGLADIPQPENALEQRKEIIRFQTLADANKWLEKNLHANDTVLFENDLPDLYESDLDLSVTFGKKLIAAGKH